VQLLKHPFTKCNNQPQAMQQPQQPTEIGGGLRLEDTGRGAGVT